MIFRSSPLLTLELASRSATCLWPSQPHSLRVSTYLLGLDICCADVSEPDSVRGLPRQYNSHHFRYHL